MSWMESLRFTCDWLNVRVDHHNLNDLIDDLAAELEGFDRTKLTLMDKGQNFYAISYHYETAGYSAITFSYTPAEGGLIRTEYSPDHPQYGILVSVSGDGCRYIDTFWSKQHGLRKFAAVLAKYKHCCTRFDATMDIFDRDNPIVPLFQEFALVAYNREPGHVAIKGGIPRSPGYVRRISVYDRDENDYTDNVYIGNRLSSRGHCVLYNKKEEIRTGRLKSLSSQIFESVGMTDNYWWRLEYRAKHNEKGLDLSNFAFQSFILDGAESSFFVVASNLFTFVDLIYGLSNIDKCDECVDWSTFLNWLSTIKNTINFVESDINSIEVEKANSYIDARVAKMKNWLFSMSSLVYRMERLFACDPHLRDLILKQGAERHNSDVKQRQFDEELARAYMTSLFFYEDVI